MTRLDKLEALYRINATILAILDVNTLLNTVTDIIDQTFGFDTCAVLLQDEKSGELYIRSSRGYDREMIKTFRTRIGGKGITGWVAQERKPLFVPDIAADSRYVPGVNGAKCEIAIPLQAGNSLIGILDIESRREYHYTKDDFEVLCIFSYQLALALRNCLAFDQEKKKANQLLVLNEIRKRISVSLDLDKMLQIVADSMHEFLGFHDIFIFLREAEGSRAHLMARAGLTPVKDAPVGDTWLDDSPVTRCIRDNQACRFSALEYPHGPLIQGANAELAVPIRIHDQCIGAVYACSGHAFDEKDRHMLQALSEQMAVIIADAEAYRKVSKKSKQMDIIHRIGQVAIQSFDFHKFVDDICRLVQDTFHYHQVAVFSWEAVSGQLELIAFAGKEGNQFRVGSKLPVDKGILGYVARSGSPYLCNDTTKEQKYADVLTHTKAELALPLCFQHKVLGVLNIESAHINAFDDSDLEIFETIAEQVAHTIGNAALFRQKTSAHDLLLKLNTLSREINATFRLDKILHVTGSILPQTIGCRLCSIFFFNPQKNLLELKVHNLPGHELSTTLKVGSEENLLMTRVIQLKRSIHVTDIEKELRIPKRPKYQTKSFLNMLISYGKRIIGVLNLSDKLDDTPFSYEEFYLVYSFCEHLANAIMNCEKYQRILELSITDGLTGLHVHRYFQDSLQREISRSRRHNLQLCLIMMDIDDFKTFNDTYGHQVGDIVLRELANIIKTTVRSTDIAARYGGEEFAIILPHTDLLNGRILAERLQQKISNHPFDISGRPLHITVSQGLSEYKNQAAGTFILHADQALLQAKRQGKNRVNTYSAM